MVTFGRIFGWHFIVLFWFVDSCISFVLSITVPCLVDLLELVCKLPAEFEPKLDYRTRNAMNNMFYANAAKVSITKYLTKVFFIWTSVKLIQAEIWGDGGLFYFHWKIIGTNIHLYKLKRRCHSTHSLDTEHTHRFEIRN